MDINLIILLIQTGTLVVIVLTLIVYYRQLKIMKSATNGQHFLALVQFLQNSEVRSAREHVLMELVKKDFKNWNDNDCNIASTVCASYGNTGVLVRLGLVDFKMIESWGPSIKRCYKICKPLIEKRRKEAGLKYWIDFDNLYKLFIKSDDNNIIA